MADTQNQPNQPVFNLPQRSLTITGALTARMYQAAIRASRIDLRAVQVAMARPAVRDPSNRAIDTFMQALARFEGELSRAEKDLDDASRNTSNRRGSSQSDDAQRHPARDTRKQQAAGNAGSAPASSDAQSTQANTSGNGSANPRKRSRNRNSGGNGAAGTAQTGAGQQQPATQQAAGAAKAAPAPAASTSESQAHMKQPVTPPADVAANLQVL